MTEEKRDELRRIQDELIRQNPRIDPRTRIGNGGPTIADLKVSLYPEWERTMKDLINEA